MAKAKRQFRQTSASRAGCATLSPRFTPTAPASRHPEAGAFVGMVVVDPKRRASVAVTDNTPTTLQVKRSPYGVSLRLSRKFVRLFASFRVPKRFKRIFKLLTKQLKPQRSKLIKPKVFRKVATPEQRRIRSPTKRRKANNEDAEGDADSHSEFWFATVTPRATRAPTLPAAHQGGSGWSVC